MPNISLGRPPIHSSLSDGAKLAPVSEAEVRAACTARLGMPLTGQMLPGTLPYYPTLPGWYRWRACFFVVTACRNKFWVWVWYDIHTDMFAVRSRREFLNSAQNGSVELQSIREPLSFIWMILELIWSICGMKWTVQNWSVPNKICPSVAFFITWAALAANMERNLRIWWLTTWAVAWPRDMQGFFYPDIMHYSALRPFSHNGRQHSKHWTFSLPWVEVHTF